MPKQKPTMTPREQLEAARRGEHASLGGSGSMPMWESRAKLGAMPMPPEEANDFSLDNGARQKMPIRYD